jgi:nucleotide-binding universal stress UspA family protein
MLDKTTALPVRGLTIAHTTNLEDAERCTFSHALALALRTGSRLVSVHANDDVTTLARMPKAVATLTQWKALPADAAAGDERRLGMQHECIVDNCCDDPVDTLVRAVRNLKPQLVVGATSGREGLARTMIGSVSEAVALQAGVPMLLMPSDCKPFVAEETGLIALGRILVAAGDAAATEAGARHALWLAELAGAAEVEIELLHVEDGATPPSPRLAQRPGVRVYLETVKGPLEAALLQRAHSLGADVVVMATRGHDSLRDVLVGSHAERVLRRAPCPLLFVPLH